MARGYPDFFGQSVFLRYGPALEVMGSVACPGGATTEVARLAGKGTIYNLTIETFDPQALADDQILLYINNNPISSPTWRQLLDNGSTPVELGEISLLCYNIETPRYYGFFSGPVTFESSVSLSYNVFGPGVVTVTARIMYGVYV